MCIWVISCPNAAHPRGAMADVIGGVPRKVTAFIKRAWEVEEDAQAFPSVTAQSPVHVPLGRSCHWGPPVCAQYVCIDANLHQIFFVCDVATSGRLLEACQTAGS